MPFIRKTDSQGSRPPTDVRKIFIGREGELLFFRQNILKPEDPTHNIISISGQGGVGKSTLLARYIDETHAPEFKDYCLIALVDERQTTPASIMEKFADQLHLTGDFEKALKQYKEVLRKLQSEREATREALLRKTTADIAGSVVKDVPIVGGILKEGVEAATSFLFEELHYRQLLKDAERLEDPVGDLSSAFVAELNRLTEIQVTISSTRAKHRQRVILFFDTFEQLAAEATPWLLDYFLEANINNNVVLVVAGRDPIEQSTPDDPKRWLPSLGNHIIYSISLDSFTWDETRAYLDERRITDPEHTETIWQLSRGLPLFLGLLTSNPLGKVDPTQGVVDNFLRWIPEQEHIKRRLALDAALFPRSFNQDDLEAFTYLTEQERPALYRWLIGQPFIRPQDEGYHYHDLAQELFSRHLYHRSKKEYYTSRRALVDHYKRLLEEKQLGSDKKVLRSAEWLELILALTYQLFLLPDEASHVKAIEQILFAYKLTDSEREEIVDNERGEIVRGLREVSRQQSAIQASLSARQYIKQILQFIKDDFDTQESPATASFLLENLIHKPSFSLDILALVYCKRGDAYSNLRKYQPALADFDRALELDPNYTAAYLRRGNVYQELKEYRSALVDFDHALELDPNYTAAYFSRAIIYWKLKEYQSALADLDSLVKLYSNRVMAYTDRGWAYWYIKEYQQAITNFDHALELDPNHAYAFTGRGWVYVHLKEYQQALSDFNRALELDYKDVAAYNGRSVIYLKSKKYQLALADSDRFVEMSPHNYMAYYRRGETYLWLEDIRQAREDFTRSWELLPTDPLRGLMVEWTGMCQERPDSGMIERLEKIAATDPEQYEAYVCRGVAMWLREDVEKAIAELERAIKRASAAWNPYFWKGIVCAALEQDEEATAMIEKSLELELPPVLLAPLRWLEQDRPAFYQKFVRHLLVRYELTG